jgi:hypothetical protein
VAQFQHHPEERFRTAAKRLAGRKRHIPVGTSGLVMAAKIHGTDLPDRDGVRRLLNEGQGLTKPELLWADGGTRAGSPVVVASVGMAPGGHTPTKPTAMAIWAGEEAAWVLGAATSTGSRARLCVPEPIATLQQGLRAIAGDGGGDDLRGDEPAHAAQVGEGSVDHFRPDDVPPFRLPNPLYTNPSQACRVRSSTTIGPISTRYRLP